MAKKNAKETERRARVEQLRKEQARKERTRSLAILGGCIVVVVGLLTAALIPYIQNRNEESVPVRQVGVDKAAAACSEVETKDASGSGQHTPDGEAIDYPDSPPSFGKHWGNFLQGPQIRTFYTRDDRPAVGQLVHSLEHGHTLLWYDDTIKSGSQAYKDIQEIAEKLGTDSYLMAVPWTAEDGDPFPEGKHIALTHWTGPEEQKGVTQYCAKPSGAVVEDFMEEYPKENTPEPGAP